MTEPEPTKNQFPGMWEELIGEMQKRDLLGQERYSTKLQPFNGRNALNDAFEEQLDGLIYLFQAKYEKFVIQQVFAQMANLVGSEEYDEVDQKIIIQMLLFLSLGQYAEAIAFWKSKMD